jgi:hypothetical protein
MRQLKSQRVVTQFRGLHGMSAVRGSAAPELAALTPKRAANDRDMQLNRRASKKEKQKEKQTVTDRP